MNTWTHAELQHLRDAWEIDVICWRDDGSLHGPVTLWHCVLEKELFVRPMRGGEVEWLFWALRTGHGQITIGDVARDVQWQLAAPGVRIPLDSALHEKYDRFGAGAVRAIADDDALAALRVVPLPRLTL